MPCYLSIILLAFSSAVTADLQLNFDDQGFDILATGETANMSTLEAIGTINLNAGMNDAWYDPATDGQGFFITVFPDTGVASLAWFTYDTEFPPLTATARLGDPGHRWLTALGPIVGNQVTMNIEFTSGGIFDAASEITRTEPPGSDGTIKLTFSSCNSGVVEYNIPSINRQGVVNIQRVANDNIVVCEELTIANTQCAQGPLEAPIPNCAPEVMASTGDLAQDCVNRVNQLRWECQCLPALERWTEGESCANQQAEYDSTRTAHAGYRDNICGNNFAQNECPGYNSVDSVIGTCLQQMWDEGPGEFPAHGHYINMTNPSYTTVACGFYAPDNNPTWSVQNFK